MKILVLKGSPHINGTTATLADRFIMGAKENPNNEIKIIDVAHANLKPCIGCDHCGMNGVCVHKDDGEKILTEILNSDLIVLVTPVYYFGMSAQLKTLIDRFYSKNGRITRKHLKVIYISAAWNDDNVVNKALSAHFDILTSYLEMDEIGRIMAKGAGYKEMIPQKCLEEAYQLGKSLQ